ncbi:MAG: hypothetical protein IJS52_08695 [Bacilli bacterium]|nr:hypothetical protein [Bacilli bacterium]
MFIERIRKTYKSGQSIFTKEILSLFPEYTRAYVFRLLKKSLCKGELFRVSHGAYCIPKKTFFGYSGISSGQVASEKYIRNEEEVFGIYSGLSLLNQFGISTQVPNVIEIVTNKETNRKRTVTIGGMKYIIRKSRFEITKENSFYYTVLQLFSELRSSDEIDDFSKRKIEEYFSENGINQRCLFQYSKSFPARTIKNLVESEVLNGTI